MYSKRNRDGNKVPITQQAEATADYLASVQWGRSTAEEQRMKEKQNYITQWLEENAKNIGT